MCPAISPGWFMLVFPAQASRARLQALRRKGSNQASTEAPVEEPSGYLLAANSKRRPT